MCRLGISIRGTEGGQAWGSMFTSARLLLVPLAVKGSHIIGDTAGEVGFLVFKPAISRMGRQDRDMHPVWAVGGLTVQGKTLLVIRKVVNVQPDVAFV